MDCSMPGYSVLHYLPEFAQIRVLWVTGANNLILCLSFLNLPSIFASIRVFSHESGHCIRWPKYVSFSFSIKFFQWIFRVLFFRIEWFDLHAIQRTLKRLLQHHNLKALIIWCSAFFIAQLSYPYITTGKTITLTIWTFVGMERSPRETSAGRSHPQTIFINIFLFSNLTISQG